MSRATYHGAPKYHNKAYGGPQQYICLSLHRLHEELTQITSPINYVKFILKIGVLPLLYYMNFLFMNIQFSMKIWMYWTYICLSLHRLHEELTQITSPINYVKFILKIGVLPLLYYMNFYLDSRQMK